MEKQTLAEPQLCPPQYRTEQGESRHSPPNTSLRLSIFLPGFAPPLPLTGFAPALLQHSRDKFVFLGQLKTRGTQAGKELPPPAAHLGGCFSLHSFPIWCSCFHLCLRAVGVDYYPSVFIFLRYFKTPTSCLITYSLPIYSNSEVTIQLSP